jgi:hypothetical protein
MTPVQYFETRRWLAIMSPDVHGPVIVLVPEEPCGGAVP